MRDRRQNLLRARLTGALLLLSLGFLPLSAAAQPETVTWEDTLDMGADMLDELGISIENLQPTMEDWQLFWNDILGALDSDSLDDYAWVLPYADGALELLEIQAPNARRMEARAFLRGHAIEAGKPLCEVHL